MKGDYKILIKHILECIEKIETYTKNLTMAKFLNSTQSQDAIIRRIEIIGEASKNIPQEIKKKISSYPLERNSWHERYAYP